MRDVGHFPCAAAAVLDVAPDLWACAVEGDGQVLYGPQQERIALKPSEADTDDTPPTGRATVGRFARFKSSSGTYDVALGFPNGYVRVFGRAGTELFALLCHEAPIVRVEWSQRPPAKELWVLFVDQTLAIIEWETEPTPKRSWRKYQLHGQQEILAVVPCADTKPSLFQVHARTGMQTALVVGCDPIVGFYHAGLDGTSVLHIAHIASAVASRAAGAVWSLAKSWGWSAEKPAASAAPAPLNVNSELGLPATPRQKARDVALSPNGRLALVPDSLGRVLLIDTASMLMLRMWKGYRDAQCGWLTMGSTTEAPGLYMVLYSARRGLVEVWRARHGPRVLVVPVGASAKLQLCTLTTAQHARCVVVLEGDDGTCSIRPIELDAASKTAVLKYFSQDLRQEETFLLHQLLDGLQSVSNASAPVPVERLAALLAQMRQLTTAAGVDAVVEALHTPAMGHLGGDFHCDAIAILLALAQQLLEGDDATYERLRAVFLLEWKLHILRAYVRLRDEAAGAPSLPGLFDEDPVRAKLDRWHACLERARPSPPSPPSPAAAPLTCLEFLACFAPPVKASGVAPDTERSLFLLLQRKARRELSFAACLDDMRALLGLPVLSTAAERALRPGFVEVCFRPLATTVFAVPNVLAVHTELGLSTDPRRHAGLFLEWFFRLPTAHVLTMTPTHSSSALQRWLTPWVVAGSYPHVLDDDGAFTLPEMAEALKAVFEACRLSLQVIHVYVLAHHLDVATRAHAASLEDATLGQISTTGAGLRWRVVQHCLAKCLYFSCLLRLPGKLSIQGVEGVDELLRAMVICQLQQAPDQIDATPLPFDADDAWTTEWRRRLDAGPANARLVAPALQSFRHLQHADTLAAFRASVLCAAWNNDRAQMSYLELALDEVDSVGRPPWKVALVVHVWETYLRTHVASILQFWVDTAAGRSLAKGLQPAVARQFLHLVRQLLDVLVAELPCPPATLDAAAVADTSIATTQLLEPIAWTGSDADVLALFAVMWPPRSSASALVGSLLDVTTVPVSSVHLHCQLLAVLDAFTVAPDVALPLPVLFGNARLCASEGLTTPVSDEAGCATARFEFVLRLLRRDVAAGFNVAGAFQLPLEPLKQEHAVFLYQSGLDSHAEELLGKLTLATAVREKLGRVARTRVAIVLSRMRSRAEYAALMTRMPADACTWVCSPKGPLHPDPTVYELDKTPSITATYYLLQQCLVWFPSPSPEHSKCSSMLGLVQSLLDQLKAERQNNPRRV
ncbi:hypothetical protein ACHHYP_11329 [Achlya hypogyna]|uniref:Rab3-GAP regulatory subunit N-terminal domain-containing protein n=1 Tax=Achlya hypogyna TaxID=1202772 RepID=A0A1V9YJC1_ACHHY|nr:hypothetical protein ACHHYP_11329 [Achlya hypogyna]